MGDLGALQSEPRREQIERVILLLKLSVAAFVQVRDVTRDGGDGGTGDGETEFFGLAEGSGLSR